MHNKKMLSVAVILTIIVTTLLLPIPATFAYEDEDIALEPISGSNFDSTTFNYNDGFNDHIISTGFAAAISALLPFESTSQLKFGCAVADLGESWEVYEWVWGTLIWHRYNPYVKEMRVEVTGDSHYTAVDDAIFDNTGTGEHSWEFLLKCFEFIGLTFTVHDIYEWLQEVYAQPPVAEWVPNLLHSSEAIMRQGGWQNLPPTYVPWLDPDLPRLQTAGANVLGTFEQNGYNTLTVSAQADIYVQNHDLQHGGVVQTYVGTYSVSFEVSVPVGIHALEVRTYSTIGEVIFDVPVWIDDDPVRYSPVYVDVEYGTTHTIMVESSFYQDNKKFTFQYWEGGSTSNPISVSISGDTMLRAYFSVNHPPACSQPSGRESGYPGTPYDYTVEVTDPENEDVYCRFNWGDSSSTTLGPYPSGTTILASHTWESEGNYEVSVTAWDPNNLESSSQPLAVAIAEPSLVTTLTELGFTNIMQVDVETFSRGTYQVKLYAEFAGYHESNGLSWYRDGTSTYTTIFTGSEGNFGFVEPPITKSFTANDEFGLSFLSPEARYFTETARNPDGLKHADVYISLTNPNMFLIGFENQLGVQPGDYNDMVISLEKTGTLPMVNLVVQVPQAPPEGVTVWINGDVYTAHANIPVSVMVEAGYQTIQVAQGFLKEEWRPGWYFIYRFDHWSDGSTQNPREICLSTDIVLTAYYVRSKYAIL